MMKELHVDEDLVVVGSQHTPRAIEVIDLETYEPKFYTCDVLGAIEVPSLVSRIVFALPAIGPPMRLH